MVQTSKYYEYLQKGGTLLQPGTSNPIGSATDNATTNSSKSQVDKNADNLVGCAVPSTGTAPTNMKASNEDEDYIMNPGSKPKNIYNLGILRIAFEILYPCCLHQNATHQWRDVYMKHKNSSSSSSSSNNNNNNNRWIHIYTNNQGRKINE